MKKFETVLSDQVDELRLRLKAAEAALSSYRHTFLTEPSKKRGRGRPPKETPAVLTALAEIGGTASIAEVANQLGIESQATGLRLARAVREGRIRRVSRGVYALNEEGTSQMCPIESKDLAIKDQLIQIRVTAEQKTTLIEAATGAGIGLSPWLLLVALQEAKRLTLRADNRSASRSGPQTYADEQRGMTDMASDCL